MATVDKIRSGLIDKILAIKNKDFLLALNKLVSLNATDVEVLELTEEQKQMLKLSEEDIKNGRFISQEAMDKRNHSFIKKQISKIHE
ncbi:hypothetical protein [Cyclobacterium qasimii]|uniref:Uncharacterized protein n=2 Tax=Cyclobacterium qasimii TaxID=1350429 RepID=S7VBG8_9BACT|nr:hypothetical protein [Cyclobacterium qasimii]EPR66912.1 hypothetical protein ADICYQ_4173 [Cyclobacterium qasimii M12-11B]GEO22948.1 hypothetical protein CQA01_34820 [Cyclobacterium qasimii]